MGEPHRETYNGYEIEVTSKKLKGSWWGEFNVKPPLSGGLYGGRIASLASGGGFKTQEEAEAAALKWAKEYIDMKAPR